MKSAEPLTRGSKSIKLTDEELLGMFRKMLELRRFEERVQKLHDQGKTVRPVHLYLGEEAIAVGVIKALEESDKLVVTYRGHGHALAKGVPMLQVMGEILGKSVGTCLGLGGSMHSAINFEHGIPMATAIVGSGIPIAAGVGLALQFTGTKNIVAVFFGDGATNTGASHEGLNLAGVWNLPVLFVCENNLYAQFTRHDVSFAGQSIASRVAGYGIKSNQFFGNDVLEVYEAAREAISYIREQNRPAFLEFRTYRKRGHAAFDDASYRPKEEVDEWIKKDPIMLFETRLRKLGLISDDSLKKIEEDLANEIENVVQQTMSAKTFPFDKLSELVYTSE